jgi:hypothetical protein
MLQEVDHGSWDRLSHAYGPAVDTPELLRQAASSDEEVAKEAVSELYGSIFHQGTVYPATVVAVRFLAELAVGAPHGRDELVWMLGQLADPEHAYGDDFPAVRAAVAAQLPTLEALLADDDQQVREAAAYAAAHAGVPAESLRQRLRVEAGEPVRASLLLALGMVDPGAAGPMLAEAAAGAAPVVRVAAAVALLRARLPWPAGAVAALVDAIDAGASVTYCWARGGDWSDELLLTPNAPVAVHLLGRLLQAREPKTRKLGLWAASQRCDASRSAPAQLVALIASALHDPDAGVRHQAVDTLARAGQAAGEYADLLAGIAAGFAQTAGSPSITAESKAIAALARLGDPRWIEPVCQAAAAGHRNPRLLDAARLRPPLLASVRERLAREPARADVLAPVLGGWQAAEALPELLAALPHAAAPATWALLQIGHADPAIVPYLRSRAEESGDPAAALAIRRITGDARPLLDILGAALSDGRRVLVGDLGDPLLPLLPAARAKLTGEAAGTHPQRETQILAARMVATADGVAPILPTVRAVLAGGDTPARAAADLVADLAPAHRDALRDLEPLLRDRLHDRWSRVAAARALARLGVPTAHLTEPLVHGVTDYAGRYGLATILDLDAVETIPALENLTTGDNRLPVTSFADDIVWADERLVDRIHDTITALRTAESGETP